MNEENKHTTEAEDHDSPDHGNEPNEMELNESHRWFVVRIATGKENKFKDLLEERIKTENKAEFFSSIMVPTEEVIELRAGQKRKVKRKYFPGYVLICMDMTDETWHMVRSVPGSYGFIGGKSNQPQPISNAEAEKILNRTAAKAEKVTQTQVFNPGELIRVTDGAFADFNGVVEEVNTEKSRLVVSVLIFGRSTPVELEFSQVEKGS
tara:strand:+ start:1435 stop:2058 length:624 start_codon:yes stop_codon:yes gene_type:complete